MKNQLLHPENTIGLFLPLLFFFGMISIQAASPRAFSHEYEKVSSKADTSEPKLEEVFKVVEEMPRFPGCEDQGLSYSEKQACAQQKLLEFIGQEINYPKKARKKNVSGIVVVKFVIDVDGSADDVEIVRDIGKGCGAEAARVVKLMNKRGIKWIPGKHKGKKVRVQFNLPVKFALNEDKTPAKSNYEKIDNQE
jgi:TonB family protein